MTLALLVALLGPSDLWHEARSCLDEEADRAQATALLEQIVSDHPDHPDAERARRTLAWLNALPHDGRIRATDDPARRRFLSEHPDAPEAALVACHLAAGLDEAGAHAVLRPYRSDPRWAWLVEREWTRRERYRAHLRRRWLRRYVPFVAGGAALLAGLLLLRRLARRRRTV